MDSLKVTAHLVDGSLLEFSESQKLLKKLRSLEAQGLKDKQLIHALLTDDWGAPPNVVVISGTDSDGKRVNISIPYR